MELPEAKRKLDYAVSQFRLKESNLLNFRNLSLPERPISHALGYYMKPLFKGYDVDCEWNKHGEEKKEEGIPDIIVHERKVDERNLLAVEVKAARNRSEIQTQKTREKILEDYEQLRKYTDNNGSLRYRWGAFILILQDETLVEWFGSGTELQELSVRR